MKASPSTPKSRTSQSSLLKVFKKGLNVSGGTAPNTPEDDGFVTVMASEYDPSWDISALTESHIPTSPLRSAFVCGGVDDRAESFDLTSRGGTTLSPPQSPEGFARMYRRSLMGFEEKKEPDDVVTKTLAYFDEFCAVPRTADPTPSVAASTSSNDRKNRLQHPECAQDHSLDCDDDTTTNPSLLSGGTFSAGDPRSQSFPATVASESPPSATATATDVANISSSPSQDHENFEVVLDVLPITSESPPTPPRRRWTFSSAKRGDMGEEEDHQDQPKLQPKQHKPKQQQQKLQSKQQPQLEQSSRTRSEDSNRRPTSSPGVDPVMEAYAKEDKAMEGVGGGQVDLAESGKSTTSGGAGVQADTKKRKTLVKRFWKSCTNLPGRAVGTVGSKQVSARRTNRKLHLAEVDNENAVARSLDLEGQEFLHQQGGHNLDFEPIAEENEDDIDESHDGIITDIGEIPGKSTQQQVQQKHEQQQQQQAQPVLESTASAWNSIFASITAVFDPEVLDPISTTNSSNQVSDLNTDDVSGSPKVENAEEQRKVAAADAKRRSTAKAPKEDSNNQDIRSSAWRRLKAIKKGTKASAEPKKTGSNGGTSQNQSKVAGEPAVTSPPPANDGTVGGITEKPKATWKAVSDPTTGKTYYYHRKTRKTTWTKPAEHKQYEIALKKWMEVSGVESEAAPITSKGATEYSGATSSRSAIRPTTSPGTENDVSKDSEAKRTATLPAESTPLDAHATIEEGKEPVTSESSMQAASRQVLSMLVPLAQPAPSKRGNDNNWEPEPSMQATSRQVLSMLVPLAQPAPSKPGNDSNWEKRNEVERLLRSLPPADATKSVDSLMKEYEGREDVLLDELRTKVEEQPFDEPVAPGQPANSYPPRSPHRFGTRTRTHTSKTSAKSALTDRTEKIKNTGRGEFNAGHVSETFSTSTSLSSKHDDEAIYNGRLSPPRRVPSRVPVPRERQLMVEELTDARLSAESYEGNGEKRGRILKGRAREHMVASDYYDGDIETEGEGTTSAYENDTYGTDSISALSENDTDFLNRKDNFEQARKRALDDAIEREDWDLAAALSEGMRASAFPGGYERAHKSWNQSELDKFIANNDWSAVRSYIARMREENKTSLKEDVYQSALKSRTNNAPKSSSANKKSIGAKSRLQHKELMSESSWTSDSHSSFETDDSDSEI